MPKPRHVIERGALGLMGGREKAGHFGWRPIDAFVFIPLNLSLTSVFVEPIMTCKDIDLGLSIGPVDHLDAFCVRPIDKLPAASVGGLFHSSAGRACRPSRLKHNTQTRAAQRHEDARGNFES